VVRAQHLLEALDPSPSWLDGFLEHLIAVYSPSAAAGMIAELDRVLSGHSTNSPTAALERSRRPGRSMGALARALAAHFVRFGLAEGTDQPERLAAQRRQRRIDTVPEPLRPVVADYATFMLAANQRARTAGTRPRSVRTIEYALTIVRDLSLFLAQRGRQQWAGVNRGDVEAFLASRTAGLRPRILIVLRQFFGWVKTRRIILVDPTGDLKARQHMGFTGPTLTY